MSLFVALGVQHAMRMRAILSSAACPALLYFSKLSHKRHDFPEKVIESKICVLIFCTKFETFLILKIIKRDININAYSSSCKVPVILVWL